MKIICAGISKTGTKSLNAALQELGYNVVYDFMEHFWEHEKYWKKIFERGGSSEDFKEMYENVDAILDAPVYAFWEEILEAFPNSKIILTVRDIDEWVDGFYEMNNVLRDNSIFLKLLGFCSPTATRLVNMVSKYTPLCHGVHFGNRWKKPNYNKMLLRKKFKEHNSYVLQNAPKDKLLVFKLGDGWEPLCKFLEKDVPDKPYPWRNKNGSAIKPLVNKHPFMKQVQKEAVMTLSVLALLGAFLYYLFLFFSGL